MTRAAALVARLLRYRALTEILVARELKARYRGTWLGFLWSFATPLLMMSIYALVFSVFMRVPVANYAAFLLAGLLPWSCFVAGLTDGMNSIIANGNLIKKVYLPSEVFPLVAVVANMLHFLFSLPVLLLVLWLSGIWPTWSLMTLPVVVAVQFLFTLAAALILSSLAAQFRDLLHLVPNVITMWFYLTPIVYDAAMVPKKFVGLLSFNPMAGLVEAYRRVFLGGAPPQLSWTLPALVASGLFAVLSLRLFRRRQELFAELV